MTPGQFKAEIERLQRISPDFMARIAPLVAANTAVAEFKNNFRTESFDGVKWKEVQRRDGHSPAYRYAARHHPARTTRNILTGDTGDLGRSIEVKEVGEGRATVWTSPQEFGSKEPYGAVHNEGLKAGRGTGFIMPRRRFMGDTPGLREKTVKELGKALDRLFKNKGGVDYDSAFSFTSGV